MKKSKQIGNLKDKFGVVCAIIAILIISYISLKISIYFVEALKILFKSYTTVAVALVTGLIAFISTIIAKILENKFSIDNEIRKERQEIYVEFLDWIINSLLYANIRKDGKLVNEIRRYQKLMTIYASDKVLKAWSKFKHIASNTVLNNKSIPEEERMKIYVNKEAIYLEKLILAIRKELGYKNKDIKEFDILKLYMDDIDKYM